MVKSLTLTLLGDGNIGKTSLVNRYVHNTKPTTYLATIFENEVKIVDIDNVRYELHFWDTAGQEGYDKITEVACAGSDIYLLCYDMSNLESLSNCLVNWLPRILQLKKCPVILIGTKMDLVKDLKEARTQGENYAKMMKVQDYFMTSSLDGTGVDEAIVGSCRKRKMRRICTIL